MNTITKRNSWDTIIKHSFRLGLENNIPLELRKLVSISNVSRWRNESESKYIGCEVTEFLKKDLELYQKMGESSQAKK